MRSDNERSDNREDDYDVCPECGYPVHATARECGKCGEKLAPRFRDRLAEQAQRFLDEHTP